VVLLGDRLLDLQHQVGGGPDLVGGGQDPGARGGELVVGDRGAGAGVPLDDDLMAVAHQLVHTGGVMATRNSLFLTSRGIPTARRSRSLTQGRVRRE